MKRHFVRHTGADRNREIDLGDRLNVLATNDCADPGALLARELSAGACLSNGLRLAAVGCALRVSARSCCHSRPSVAAFRPSCPCQPNPFLRSARSCPWADRSSCCSLGSIFRPWGWPSCCPERAGFCPGAAFFHRTGPRRYPRHHCDSSGPQREVRRVRPTARRGRFLARWRIRFRRSAPPRPPTSSSDWSWNISSRVGIARAEQRKEMCDVPRSRAVPPVLFCECAMNNAAQKAGGWAAGSFVYRCRKARGSKTSLNRSPCRSGRCRSFPSGHRDRRRPPPLACRSRSSACRSCPCPRRA